MTSLSGKFSFRVCVTSFVFCLCDKSVWQILVFASVWQLKFSDCVTSLCDIFSFRVCVTSLALFVAESKAFVTWFLLTTWLEDWVPLAKKILCGGIPVSVITLMTLLFIGCCLMAHFDLVLWLGGSLRPKVLVLETLAAEFIVDVSFIVRLVDISFLYMREILGWMRNNRSIMHQLYKVPDLGQKFLQLHIRSAENPDNFG